jgi:hypothetical protein
MNPHTPEPLLTGQHIVFIGDSITDLDAASPYRRTATVT